MSPKTPACLKTRIADDMKSAMRGKDALKLEVIRLIRAAIQRKEVDERVGLDDDGVLKVLRKMHKQSRDALGQFEAGGREDLAAKERAALGIFEAYLPQPLSEADLERLIDGAFADTGAAAPRDVGKVMGYLKPRIDGRADMGAVSARVRQRLGG